MAPPPTTIKSKEVCMTERDWQAFGDALQEMFPRARYYVDIRRGIKTPAPPELVFHRHLRAMAVDTYLDRITMVFDPFWRPSFHKSFYNEIEQPEKWHWALLPPPHPTVWFKLGSRVWLEQGPPHHGVGEIDFYGTPKNRDHASLAGRFYRLFGKFATNRRVAWVRFPDYLTTTPEKGSPFWCGHDALQWAREDTRRFLHFNGRSGLRPVDAPAQVVPLRKSPAVQG